MAVAHTQVQAQNSGQKFDIQEQQHNNRHLHHQSSTTMASSASTPSASSAAAASSDPIISTDPAFGVHSPATWSGHEVNAGQKRMSGDDSGNSSGGVKKQQQQQQKKEKEKQNKWPRGKKPAVVIIARHGTRLDSVDKHWHLTSPTPYDPPLTYGGWTQARALGAKIASLLNILEVDFEAQREKREAAAEKGQQFSAEASSASDKKKKRRRRRRITIHSSPFLRCVQTSVAIAAGINQDQRPHRHHSLPNNRVPLHSTPLSNLTNIPGSIIPPLSSASSGPTTATSTIRHQANLQPIPEPEDTDYDTEHSPPFPTTGPGAGPGINKCRLKIDPFLGEWLCHDYFEDNGIMAPPGSALMLAAAKAELMRRDEQIEAGWSAFGLGHAPAPVAASPPMTTNVNAGSASKIWTAAGGDTEQQSTQSQSVPITHRDRSATTSSTHPHISIVPEEAHPELLTRPPFYAPPTPTYAISYSASIPPGYVAHARDACAHVDYAWDSMRAPLHWGSGGQYGEEWSSMHDRFGKGLRRLIGWYESGGADEQERTLFRKLSGEERGGNEDDGDESEEEEVDDVVILVSHGAGCNALLGALTGDPVLTDVPMTSLSMAVRKDLINGPSSAPTSAAPSAANSRRSSMISYTSSSHFASRSRSESQSNYSLQYSNPFSPCLSHSSSHSSMHSVKDTNAAQDADSSQHHDNQIKEQEDENAVYEPHIADTYEIKLLASVEHLRGQNPLHNLSAARSIPRGQPRGHPSQNGGYVMQHHHAHSFTGGRPSSLSRLAFLNTSDVAQSGFGGSAISPTGMFSPVALSSFSIPGAGSTTGKGTRRASGLWGNTSSVVDAVPVIPGGGGASLPTVSLNVAPTITTTNADRKYTFDHKGNDKDDDDKKYSSSPLDRDTANALGLPEFHDTVWNKTASVKSSAISSSSNSSASSSSSSSTTAKSQGAVSPGTQPINVTFKAPVITIPTTLPAAPPAQHGLWGSPTLPTPNDGHKRRWTMTEKPAGL